jgi:hypothetical protein
MGHYWGHWQNIILYGIESSKFVNLFRGDFLRKKKKRAFEYVSWHNDSIDVSQCTVMS